MPKWCRAESILFHFIHCYSMNMYTLYTNEIIGTNSLIITRRQVNFYFHHNFLNRKYSCIAAIFLFPHFGFGFTINRELDKKQNII